MELKETIIKILFSGILSGIIGFERQKHGREAGLRTMILVGMGTTAILISSFQVYYIFANSQNQILRIDPARIAYGVVTGIGFLGAGVIVKDHERVRGLTTAASMWFVTSLGIAIGVGLYLLSIFLTFFAVVVLYFLRLYEKKFSVDTYNKISISLVDIDALKEKIKEIIQREGFKILSTEIEKDIENKTLKIDFILRHKTPEKIEDLILKISKVEGIKKINLR